MFIGEFQHNIDQKGRMAIPVKFRDELTNGAVVTRGIDKCLFIFTKSEWNALAEKISKLPLVQSNSRAFARLMFAGAIDVEIDKQGRVLVSDYLRKYAGLSKQVVVAGVFNRLEVWDKSSWQDYKMKTEKESGDIAEKLSELGV
ncbi:MAG: cell division/cell wall cluster transcriptional repressor MraZ [Candidatus Brennerbacteria bacterium RIFOXYC1_FULL_41_11]|uniref:Transcriptional regulator MraZ n=1 Tax=Candidatus Brennerbacteria bacterium RIFOXYD1_FULL_41_16 TaxID=1797529 RepID=A0A1G1XLI3_9BACT|nr:MAG: cell division/cell wall cluster transcriptional repressor MraZ [Candidatus Brennerbacteria bacterium RIFOXYB1_FULL_41_13]OGY40402.1 MAG: cell division/cell wall cluster transcriptional repressor MraZ [Candidatus Brennerbacteria bacterium RIFOXYC1_FULL_41_11]OGY40831.1 MAG: cell division/cell wall cluster transcriptional repressor MraZ [Candidatus Brennerbacteria bacterium RIFOXYD1_FULL_41_16]